MKNKKITLFLVILAVLLIGAGTTYGVVQGRSSSAGSARQEEALKNEINSFSTETQLAYDTLNHELIYDGVQAMGISLGGLTVDEAKEVLNSAFSDQITSKKVTLAYEDKTWEYTYAELGFTANIEDIAAQAFSIGRSGTLQQRYGLVKNLADENISYDITDQYDPSIIDEILEEIRQEIDVTPVNATVSLKDGSFSYTDEAIGYSLNVENSKAVVSSAIDNREEGTIDLIIDEVAPARTKAELSRIKDVLGEFTTSYNANVAGRSKNVMTGASFINGTVVMPGEEFAFNILVAPVTVENGYATAPELVNGEYVDGIGGGLCQVSSTLYNAVILAELEVTERSPHSLKSSYVKAGMDAAVAQGYLDFKFVNTTDAPVYIYEYASGGKITARIYGEETRDPSRTISFSTTVAQTIPKPAEIVTEDNTMPEGQRVVTVNGQEGQKVDVYKVVTQNGQTTSTYFNSSTYIAKADRVTVGTKKVEVSEPEDNNSSTEDDSE